MPLVLTLRVTVHLQADRIGAAAAPHGRAQVDVRELPRGQEAVKPAERDVAVVLGHPAPRHVRHSRRRAGRWGGWARGAAAS